MPYRKKKLLYVAGSTIPSRSANSLQVMLMCQALSRAGLEVGLVTPLKLWHYWRTRDTNAQEYYGIETPFAIKRFPYPSPHLFFNHDVFTYYLGANLIAARHVKRRQPDFCYTRDMRVAWATARMGLDTIYESHEPLPTARKARNLAQAAQLDSMLAIVAISAALAEMLETNSIPREKIVVAHDGVDMTRFEPRLTRLEARRQLGLPLDRQIAAYSGHLSWWGNKTDIRGTGHILECSSMFPNVLFLLVGGWDKDVRRFQTQSSDANNVKLTGYVQSNKVPLYLTAADVLMMPYTSHLPTAGWCSPLKMFEYMASGHPILASDLPTIREVLKHEHNALLITPGSTESLADGLRRVLANRELATRIGKQALQDVSNYTWDRRVERILDFAHIRQGLR